MISIKANIISKINNADDEQLLAEIYRILEADNYIFTNEDVQSFKDADKNINGGSFINHKQLKDNMQLWLNNLK